MNGSAPQICGAVFICVSEVSDVPEITLLGIKRMLATCPYTPPCNPSSECRSQQ
ncbi:hypothetical protein Z950_2319 [Sulfitobacter mediterraneus KCTC 32188]|nr:hypothetical protein Z950_2319 [Sulfitobacter mediterraneus KCTC 32188]